MIRFKSKTITKIKEYIYSKLDILIAEFTLLELVILVAIIVLLGSVAFEFIND